MSALSEDLAAKGHVDGRERMGLDVLSLVVQLLIEQLIQSVVHALRTIVGVHLGAGRLPRQLWGPPPFLYPVASPLCVFPPPPTNCHQRHNRFKHGNRW